METWEWVFLAAAAVAALILLAALVSIRRRRSRLETRFGPEYQRAVSSSGRGDAERRLADAQRRREELEIRPLSAVARDRYLEEWRQAEARFVTDPRDAARAAERVVAHILEERGYPTDGDTEDQAALVAADHPDVVERYRHGHAMLDLVNGNEGTENLRKAMIDFRAVCEELLQAEPTAV